MTERQADMRRQLERLRRERKRCVRLLAEAIDSAERWYSDREAQLRAFDRRSATTVARLVSDGRVAPTTAWKAAA